MSLRTAIPLLASLLVACAPPAPPVAPSTPEAPKVDPRVDPSRLHVLLINGGGEPSINYQSHLLHLKAMRETLLGSGIAPERMTFFSGDGADPALDLVTRKSGVDQHAWLYYGTRQERLLAAQKVMVSSAIPGVRLLPSTKKDISAWFAEARTKLHAGDVLMVYVTDHGRRDKADPLGNNIMLWKGDKLDVRDLGALVDTLDPGVRIVSLMSQCYSGAFAALATRPADHPRPQFCGYFSAPSDRLAYGCYPEDDNRDQPGHSFRMIKNLTSTRSLSAAHDATLVDDDVPDAPLKTSDAYLDDLVRKAAKDRSIAPDALTDELLPTASGDPAWALVDRMAAMYGLESPRTVAAIAKMQLDLPEIERGFEASRRSWTAAWKDATGHNAKAFLAARNPWKERLDDKSLKGMGAADVRAMATPFLNDLATFTSEPTRARIAMYRDRTDTAREAIFRIDVRLAVTLRMRTVLRSIAGRALLAKGEHATERAALDALHTCEDFRLPGAAPAIPPAPPQKPLSSLADERRLDAELRPTWFGFHFVDPTIAQRKKSKLTEGAALVSAVYPDAPAGVAGMEVGDVLLGPPGAPFKNHGDIRAWALLATLGKPTPLTVLRDKKRIDLALTPIHAPFALPAPPPALIVGKPVPTIDMQVYRGSKVNLHDGKAHLVMFWATWCKPCKVALPELHAFAKQKRTDVIAVTDEDVAKVDEFFKNDTKSKFPDTMAIDTKHHAVDLFGARSRPVFVLIDKKGKVVGVTKGYDPKKGLDLPGWKWNGK